MTLRPSGGRIAGSAFLPARLARPLLLAAVAIGAAGLALSRGASLQLRLGPEPPPPVVVVQQPAPLYRVEVTMPQPVVPGVAIEPAVRVSPVAAAPVAPAEPAPPAVGLEPISRPPGSPWYPCSRRGHCTAPTPYR